MKPWDIDSEHGAFLIFKYRTIENRPFSCLVQYICGRTTIVERRTWNGCGWEVWAGEYRESF